MVLNGFPDGSGLSSGVARVCDSGLSPQAVAREWVQVRELDTSPDSCCVLLSRFEVLGVHDIFPQPLHGHGGAGAAFSFVLLKSLIIYLFGLECVEDQVGFLPPCSQMFYLVSLMEPHCDTIDVDPGGVDDCISVKLTLHKHFCVVNIEDTAHFHSS